MMDVYALYHQSLSYRHAIPRTPDPDLPPSATSTSFAYLLGPSPPAHCPMRATICSASHPDPMRGRREAEAVYQTVLDTRPLGNGRCRKVGPTHMYCDICWQVDRVQARETTLHIIRDCPYSQLALDPILRELYAAAKPHSAQVTSHTAAELLSGDELLIITGCTDASKLELDGVLGTNIAGCISRALFERASLNAPRDRPAPLHFSPTSVYKRFVNFLQTRATHTHRLALELDGRMAILHPGIEPWLEDHGQVFKWLEAWGPLLGTGTGLVLSLPCSLDQAHVGNTGTLGVPLPLHILPRLSLSSHNTIT
jgi:hypothetical protein